MEIFLLAAVTCLVIITAGYVISESLLFTSGLMAQPLYTSIMAAFIILKPIIVAAFSRSLTTVRDTVGEGRQMEPVLVPEPAVQGVVHDYRS